MSSLKRYVAGLGVILVVAVAALAAFAPQDQDARAPAVEAAAYDEPTGPELWHHRGNESFSFASAQAKEAGLWVQESSDANCIIAWGLPEDTRAWASLEVTFTVEGSTEEIEFRMASFRPDGVNRTLREVSTSPVRPDIGPVELGTGTGEADPAALWRVQAPQREAASYEVTMSYDLAIDSPVDPDVTRGRCT